MIKAIFFDIDGTLVDFGTHGLTGETHAALTALRERGVKLFLATGRNPRSLKQSGAEELFAFDGVVCLNGQLCYDRGGVFSRRAIAREDIAALLPLLERYGLPCTFIEEQYVYINAMTDKVAHALESVRITPPPAEDPRRALQGDVLQLVLYADPAEEALILPHLKHCRSARWNPRSTDIIPAHGGKDRSIDDMLARFGISLSESMAFGDGHNDISMLRHAGIGVAMGNAHDDVKAAADYITADCAKNGVAEALRHFGLI